jgi:CubicO group peptidase (beta-lactamase class C family)
MTTLSNLTLGDLLATPVMQTLGLTLVHFLWQGTLVTLFIAVLLYVLKDSSPSTRYAMSCAGLAVMTLLPICTFAYLAPTVKPVYQFTDEPRAALQAANTPPDSSTPTPQPMTTPVANSSENAEVRTVSQTTPRFTLNASSFRIHLPWLVAAWLVGVLVLSVRLVGGLWLARQLRTKATKPVSEVLESKLRELTSKLNISKNVKLRESLAIKVPVVIGWLRPVILLPSSAITGLSVRQLELILAHELAHIHRHDYVVNLLQKIAETLLFYHPAVWWVSGVIRQERENCCDDLAIAVCEGDRLAYAKTLSMLDSMRPSNQIALAADGGSLLRRIQRLAGKNVNTNNPAQWFVGVLMMLVPWVVLSVATAQAKLPTEIAQNIDAFVESRLEASFTPGLQLAVVQNGEVTFSKAYGFADVENNRPMTIDTPIQLGGEGGFFFVVFALHQLHEKGLINFNDTISEHLPWVHFQKDKELTITVQNLIDGTANIPDNIKVKGLVPFSKGENSPFDSNVKTAEEYIRSLTPAELYSNLTRQSSFIINDTLLILMIEAISGMPFEEYTNQNIFGPIGMTTTYNTQKAKERGLATLYRVEIQRDAETQKATRIAKPTTFEPPQALNSALGFSLSSQDAAKFLIAILNKDSRLLSESSWNKIFPPQPNVVGVGSSLTEVTRQNMYGLGGNLPTSGYFMDIIPGTKTGFVLLTNSSNMATDKHPVNEVWGSISMSMAILDSEIKGTLNNNKNTPRKNPISSSITRLSGAYETAMGPLELFAEGEELHGRLAEHEFKLEQLSDFYIVSSDFSQLDGLMMKESGGRLELTDRLFAYKVE